MEEVSDLMNYVIDKTIADNPDYNIVVEQGEDGYGPYTSTRKVSKYYTPTIEEFHVGFEYYFCSAYQEGVSATEIVIDGIDGYEPQVFNFEIWNYERNDGESWRSVFESMIDHNQVKVKYLDKEDIESLGWVYKEDRGMEENNGSLYVIKDTNFQESTIELKYWFINNRLQIRSLIGVLFDGTIKNKSELKVLMKQLGIDGNTK